MVLLYVLCKPFPKFLRTTLTYLSNVPNHILTHWQRMLNTCNMQGDAQNVVKSPINVSALLQLTFKICLLHTTTSI